MQAAIEAGSGIQVYTQTSAKRIIIGGDNKTATGVLFGTNNYPFTLSAKREVFVAAGAVSYLSLSESSLTYVIVVQISVIVDGIQDQTC